MGLFMWGLTGSVALRDAGRSPPAFVRNHSRPRCHLQEEIHMPKVIYHSGEGNINGTTCGRGWYFEIDGTVWGRQTEALNEQGYRTERLAQIALRNYLQQNHWVVIWRKALGNMPYRIQLSGPEEFWSPLPKGETSIPEVIRGLAKGYYQRDGDGNICEYSQMYHMRRFGQQNCLTRLMKFESVAGVYTKPNRKWRLGMPYQVPQRIGKKKVIAHNTVYNNIRRGSMPKEKWRQDLLIRLTQDDGRQVAAQLLRQQGFDLDKYNYVY